MCSAASRRAFMPTTPSSHPLWITPWPSVNTKGWLVHDDCTTLRDEYVANTY